MGDVPPDDPAEELARLRAGLRAFSSVVAHDLKTPLANLSSFAQLLPMVATDLGDEASTIVDRMVANARRASRMVEDVVTHARVLGHVPVREPVALADAAGEACELLADEIDAAAAEVTLGALPVVSGDPDLLVRLFTLLVDNAVRYHDGKPVVGVDVVAVDDPDVVCVCVADDGPGIPAEHRETVFELGTRLVDRGGDIEGSGVGLATARTIVEHHHGTITVGGPPEGSGTVVTVTLPAAP